MSEEKVGRTLDHHGKFVDVWEDEDGYRWTVDEDGDSKELHNQEDYERFEDE